MDQLLRLIFDRCHHQRVAVAGRVDGDAAHAVQVTAAIGIPDPGALPPDQHQGQPGIVLHQVLLSVPDYLISVLQACSC